jgi:hypothetical protein
VPLDRVRSAGQRRRHGRAHRALLGGGAAGGGGAGEPHPKVETAIEPRFQEHFVAANAIPHATDPFPHLPPPADVSFNAARRAAARGPLRA